jgi:nicotinamidase-related amidase
MIKKESCVMKTALLLIDIQNDYFPGGRMELDESPKASLRAKELLRLFRDRNLPIFHIQHISNRKGASFFLPDTTGVEIHANVSPLPGETIVRKNFPNSFRNTDLLTQLKDAEVDQLVICGMMTHMCVDATVRAAFDHGYDCVVIQDACATKGLTFNGVEIPSEKVHGAFLAALGAVYARIYSSDEFAAQMKEKPS